MPVYQAHIIEKGYFELVNELVKFNFSYCKRYFERGCKSHKVLKFIIAEALYMPYLMRLASKPSIKN